MLTSCFHPEVKYCKIMQLLMKHQIKYKWWTQVEPFTTFSINIFLCIDRDNAVIVVILLMLFIFIAICGHIIIACPVGYLSQSVFLSIFFTLTVRVCLMRTVKCEGDNQMKWAKRDYSVSSTNFADTFSAVVSVAPQDWLNVCVCACVNVCVSVWVCRKKGGGRFWTMSYLFSTGCFFRLQ